MSTIRLKSTADCESLIGKRVEYKYRPRLFHTGTVQSFEQVGRTIYFKVLTEQTKCLTELKTNRLMKII